MCYLISLIITSFFIFLSPRKQNRDEIVSPTVSTGESPLCITTHQYTFFFLNLYTKLHGRMFFKSMTHMGLDTVPTRNSVIKLSCVLIVCFSLLLFFVTSCAQQLVSEPWFGLVGEREWILVLDQL
jgi:hypothetical protein